MIGYHAYIDKGIPAAFDGTTSYENIGAVQIFFRSPRAINTKHREFSDADFDAREKYIDINLMSHSPYRMNLAKTVLKANSPETLMIHDDMVCNDIMAGIGTVIHIGSNTVKSRTNEDAMKIAVANINMIVETYPEYAKKFDIKNPEAKLILENNAREGNKVFWQVDSLPPIASGGDSIGYCLDTQHLFASGYDVSSIQKCEDMVREFDAAVGKKRLSVIHLNDSEVELDGRRDRHAQIGTGKIWSVNKSSLRFWAKLSRDLDIPLILETGKVDHTTEFKHVIDALKK